MSSDFKAALPIPLKWSTSDNRYDQTGKQPRALSLFIPRDSAVALAQYIMNSADDNERQKTGKVWDYDKKAEVEVEGFYINGKGREGNGGDFGTINPASTKWLNGPQEIPGVDTPF
jgi:hypothetical protein